MWIILPHETLGAPVSFPNRATGPLSVLTRTGQIPATCTTSNGAVTPGGQEFVNLDHGL
jgi:hypothetical protein